MRNQLLNNKGTSLIEVAISSALILIVASGVSHLFLQSQKYSSTIRRNIGVNEVVNSIETILKSKNKCTEKLDVPAGANILAVNDDIDFSEAAGSTASKFLKSLKTGGFPTPGLRIDHFKVVEVVNFANGFSSATLELKMVFASEASGAKLVAIGGDPPIQKFILNYRRTAGNVFSECLAPTLESQKEIYCRAVSGTPLTTGDFEKIIEDPGSPGDFIMVPIPAGEVVCSPCFAMGGTALVNSRDNSDADPWNDFPGPATALPDKCQF